MTNIFLIKKPIVTEKSMDIGALNKYVFMVKKEATKPEIKKVVKAIYKVDAVFVNIVNRHPKSKRVGAFRGRQRGYKKAIVTLKEGQKIDIQ